MIPLLKSEFSFGKSLLQLKPLKSDEPNSPDQPDTIVGIAKEYGWKSVTMVEDSLGGFIPIWKELKKLEIGLVYGWRVTVTDDTTIKEKRAGSKIIIFVKSALGWKSLVKLANFAQVDGFFEEARLDWKKIHELWNDELVMAIPHYDGMIMKNLTTKNPVIPDFGNIRPYLFVERNDMFYDEMVAAKSEEYAKAFGLEAVEVKSCYYKNRGDLIYLQCRKLMDRKTHKGGNLMEPEMEFFFSNEFCVESALPFIDDKKSGQIKFESEFKEPLELFLPGVRLPEFIMSKEDRKELNIPNGATDIEILKILARDGYKKKLASGEIDKSRAKEYGERANYELDILEKTDFHPYILLVYDVMRFLEKNGYPTGEGRGSCCGCLLLYLIGATRVDPLPNELYFERFISVSRAKTIEIDGIKYLTSLPDADLDMSEGARDAAVKYLSEKYKGKFVKLSTYNTQTTKALLTDVGKIVCGYDKDDLKVISDTIVKTYGNVASPEESYENSTKFKEFCDKSPLAYKVIIKLQGIIKNPGTHPSAFLISYYPLDDFMPIESRYNNEDKIWETATSCDMVVSESMAVKLDLLGLKTVEIIDNIIKDLGINLTQMDYNNWEDIYQHLQKLEVPSNLFQISGSSAVGGLNKIKPKSLDNLAAVLAICRPGSFAFIDQYAAYVNGVGERPNVHPFFDDILEKTGYVVLFQESLMKMYEKCGFSLADANDIRVCVSKKKTEEMAKWEPKIYEMCEKNGIDIEAGRALWAISKASADYSFNKSCALDSKVETKNGEKELKDIQIGDEVLAFDSKNGVNHFVKVLDVDFHDAFLYDIEFEDGKKTKCSMDHKFLTKEEGMAPMSKIIRKGLSVASF
jgi:DNA polymerase-3 subunit alpha